MSSETDKQLHWDLRSFGRKRGRKPSPRQHGLLAEALPRLRVDPASLADRPLTSIFEAKINEVWLEIGFGGGEHLIAEAVAHPDVGFIGCEPFQDGVVKALTAIEERRLGNVRLHPDDARPLVRSLPPACLGRVFILFPDPWPKARHAKRRLLSRPLLDDLARVMRPGAELRLATDIGPYARTVLLAALPHPCFRWTAKAAADWRHPWPGWPGTRYEAKARREGRHPMFLTFVRL